jgi:3-phenylpropionate/trans-cinnamate dioxygenase ferredoxin component
MLRVASGGSIVEWEEQMGDWVAVAEVDDLIESKAIRVGVDGEAVFVVKAGDEVFAIGNQCTHQGAGLDRGVVKIAGSVRTVTCPAHGSTFNLETGKVMRPPATKPVPVYDVKVEDGRVFVRPREEP